MNLPGQDTLAYKKRLRVTVSKMKEFYKVPGVRQYASAALAGAVLGRRAFNEGRDIYRAGRGLYRGARRVYQRGRDMVRGYKRKRSSSRFSRRQRPRRNRRGGRGSRFGISAQAGDVVSSGFRRRRLRPRTLRRYLWRDTIYKNHYRSMFDTSGTQLAAASLNQAKWGATPVLPTATTFWTAAGGAQRSDAATPVPDFNGDIVIRGGMARATFNNQGASDSMRVRLWIVRTNGSPDFTVLPSATLVATDVASTSWDPSLLPDFASFGKVIRSYEFLLLSGQRPITIKFPLKTRKIDQERFSTPKLASRFYWMYTYSDVSNVDAVVGTIQHHFSHNLSFVGDAVRPGT